jgi:hypothetical protein
MRHAESSLKDEMPEKPNIMGGRFVLTIKDSGRVRKHIRRDMSSKASP